MFCEKIRFLREHQELSQGEVAKRLNLTQASYSRYERGTNEPNLDTLKRIAKFFDCTVDYLLEMDDISSDNDKVIDLNTFLLNGKYTIHSRFPTNKQRRMISNIINEIFEDREMER